VGICILGGQHWSDGGHPIGRHVICRDLQVCGTQFSVSVALERLRAVRASVFPDWIVIREAPIKDIALWRLAFGPSTNWQGLQQAGGKLSCLIFKLVFLGLLCPEKLPIEQS